MARRDVPYPGGRCSLKCELENLWRELRTKLKSINGVPGDGAGDVKLKAGANVTITNDAAHNEITISAEDAVGIAKINNTNPDSGGNFGISGDSHITITPQTNGMQIGTTGLATSAELADVIDGTTPVQKATDADHQTSADSATNAGHQTTAASATNADHQTSADSQTTAGSATTAGSQTSAGEAAKLSTARSIKTNLASTAAASFDGSSDITPGVDGVLPIANGGTGSNVKNFVDTSNNQKIDGIKTFMRPSVYGQLNIGKGVKKSIINTNQDIARLLTGQIYNESETDIVGLTNIITRTGPTLSIMRFNNFFNTTDNSACSVQLELRAYSNGSASLIIYNTDNSEPPVTTTTTLWSS